MSKHAHSCWENENIAARDFNEMYTGVRFIIVRLRNRGFHEYASYHIDMLGQS